MGVSFTRQTAVVLVAVGVLLVGGAFAWGAFGAESSGGGAPTAADGERVEQQNESNGSEQNESDGNESVITSNQTVEAFETVENETNGTVFGARLSGEMSGDLDESEFVYELDVLAENGSHLVAKVYAANATVASVESANDSDGFFADIFGSSDDVPEEARNTDELRSATDAVRLAVNETDSQNQTVTRVVLETRNDTLVYRVQQFEAGGDRREVIVAATGDEGVVTTDPQTNRGLLSEVRAKR